MKNIREKESMFPHTGRTLFALLCFPPPFLLIPYWVKYFLWTLWRTVWGFVRLSCQGHIMRAQNFTQALGSLLILLVIIFITGNKNQTFTKALMQELQTPHILL